MFNEDKYTHYYKEFNAKKYQKIFLYVFKNYFK